MNRWKQKLEALLEGMDIINWEEFIDVGDVGDYRKLGEMIYENSVANKRVIERLESREQAEVIKARNLERNRCLDIIKAYPIPVGNAGDMGYEIARQCLWELWVEIEEDLGDEL